MQNNDRPLILVVDDETKIRRLLATNLENYGFDVMTAADGALAVEVYSKSNPRPDLVVLDILSDQKEVLEGILVPMRTRSTIEHIRL